MLFLATGGYLGPVGLSAYRCAFVLNPLILQEPNSVSREPASNDTVSSSLPSHEFGVNKEFCNPLLENIELQI